MSKKIMAICDRETDYANRFQEYVNRKVAFSFQVQMFSTPEQLLQFSKSNKIEITILSENAYTEAINELDTSHIVLLSETGTVINEALFMISKYQSSEKIIHEILYVYGKSDSHQKQKKGLSKNVKMLGIYTPIGRCLQTSFALLLGQFLGRKNRVLYLNFEPFSGFGKFMKREYQTDIIDMMYLMNQMQDKFSAKMHSMIENVNGLDYIPPAFSFMDLSSISGEKWVQFLEYMEREGNYDYIILDLSDNVQGLLSILQKCYKVYTLTREDGMSMAKIDQYERLLQTLEYQDILQKTKQFAFPQMKNIPMEVEQLPYCDLARFVKAIMKEDLNEELSGT
ncbi:MAG: hypothetical protein PHE02_09385 [Lachnospiraceae bacterium]|nr:hypothetical protein [Lachnospiraceae bacterium]